MWPFNEPKRAAIEPEPVDESVEARVTALEQRMSTIEFEWESVVSKLRQKVARDASRARRELEQQLDQGDDAGGGEFVGPESTSGHPQPGSMEYRAMQKAALRAKAANLRNGRTG